LATILDIDDARWAAFVDSRPEATVFHHPAWCRVISETYGFRPSALVDQGVGDTLVSGLPLIEVSSGRRRLESLPFTDTCPPLADDGDVDALVAALDSYRMERGARCARIHAEVGALRVAHQSRGVIHTLALSRDADAVRRTFNRSQVQRNIARSEQERVSVERVCGREDIVETFYALHVRTRRRQGVPVQPRRFFEAIWRLIIAPGLGFVSIARVGGQAIAAAVFFSWNGTLTYKFGASDPAGWQHRPNHAIFWHAIRWGCEQGYTVLDFGRTDADNPSLRAFKSGWGTVERELVYSSLGAPPSGSGSRGRLLAPLIRHSPPIVCKALGGALYRYAA
jgi:CelD/BcsL family acetyltransferase involved in cellulose biosynthesis